MLNREFAPAKGLWSGVGGKIKTNEMPLECVIREVQEETGIDISGFQIEFKGTVTWNVDNLYSGGMYVFLVDIPSDYLYPTPIKTDEGILDWKSISWLLGEKNHGVGEMIPKYLPLVLNDSKKYEYRCVLINSKLVEFTYEELKKDKVQI